ncbi:AMP-dependent synthetase/ligase [Penicillium hordei]|uniref:AMP-dependent synthetase/ligase n=1 Tax=Penicillium hordei TaxID=40994 RepID=A0AAD6E6A8_9EURO|nr:AMP-dependent synthetase/ligase [Penicillium hordei]KAJ5602736.1 AMP-dependent synthetase/ligase [Penicillium hordei]
MAFRLYKRQQDGIKRPIYHNGRDRAASARVLAGAARGKPARRAALLQARSAIPSGKAQVHHFALDDQLYKEPQAFCQTHQATPFVVLLAAFRATHYRLTGVDDATIATPIHSNTNLLCVRTTVELEDSFHALVQRVQQTNSAASSNQDVAFQKIVSELRPGAADRSRLDGAATEIFGRGLKTPEALVSTLPLTQGLSALADMGLTDVAGTDYLRDSSVVELFRREVSLSPSAVTVKNAYSSSQLTYAELERQSDQLAPETMVAVLAPRSCETIVALLAILKANLAYLPLDVNVPVGPLESILSAREAVRSCMLTPALLKQCLASAPSALSSLELLFAAGDRLDPRDAAQAKGIIEGDLVNGYGPTENTTFSAIYKVPANQKCVNGMPIAVAISNSGAFIMDPQQRLVPPGVMGRAGGAC